jgi:hypothetical protein
MWPAFAGVGLHLVLREVLNPWLNASNDAKFWSAAALLALPLLFSVYAIFRAIVSPQRR